MIDYNLFISAVISLSNFLIWECKLRKEIVPVGTLIENLLTSVKKWLYISSALRTVKNKIDFFVCRHISDPPWRDGEWGGQTGGGVQQQHGHQHVGCQSRERQRGQVPPSWAAKPGGRRPLTIGCVRWPGGAWPASYEGEHKEGGGHRGRHGGGPKHRNVCNAQNATCNHKIIPFLVKSFLAILWAYITYYVVSVGNDIEFESWIIPIFKLLQCALLLHMICA